MNKLLISIVMTVLIGSAQISNATSIGFSNWHSTGGSGYAVDVVVSGLTAGGIVSAYDLDVKYGAMLTASSVTFGTLLGSEFAAQVMQSYNLRTGFVDFAAVSLLSDADLLTLQAGYGGSVTLATLNFTGTNAGFSSLAFDWYKGQDVKGAGNEIIAGYVPEPGTFLLMGSGLLSLLGFRRRGSLMARFRK